MGTVTLRVVHYVFTGFESRPGLGHFAEAHGCHGSLIQLEQVARMGALHALSAALKEAQVLHCGHVHRFSEDAVLYG